MSVNLARLLERVSFRTKRESFLSLNVKLISHSHSFGLIILEYFVCFSNKGNAHTEITGQSGKDI